MSENRVTGHVFIACSLDGFIARKDGDIGWLQGPGEGNEDYGYKAFAGTIDGIIMGRGTFEHAQGFDPWPFDVPVVVLSKSLNSEQIPGPLTDKVRVSRASPGEIMSELHQAGWRKAYVDGGQVIQSFLRDGLVADMVITRIPILIGEGRSLFGATGQDIPLKHVSTAHYDSGFVQSTYVVGR